MKIVTTFQLQSVDVESTYSGKNGCSCGCGGNYAEPNSIATKKRLIKINQNLDECEVIESSDQYIFELITKQPDEYSDGRVIRAYVPKSKLYNDEQQAIKDLIDRKEVKA